MFRRPYKIKTSSTIKGSDRRKLRGIVEKQYPTISVETLNSLMPNKGELSQVKAMTHSGTIVMIFYSGKNPIFFQMWETCYPTLYTLWKYPELLTTLTMVPFVMEKIENGADLMAPGIIVTESNISVVKELKVNDVCAINMAGNLSAVAVGTAKMSGEELCIDGVKGKAVSIIHFYKDTLFMSGEQLDIPLILESEVNEINDEINEINDEINEINIRENETVVESEQMSPREELENKTVVDSENNILQNCNEITVAENTLFSTYTMDEILEKSFLTAVKVHGKKLALPMLTSTFYSSYVLKSCPQSLNLDIKKTSYKKLSVFLKKMQKEGILQIKELSKGVESIISVNIEHDMILSFSLDQIFKEHLKSEKEKSTEELPSDNIQASYKFPIVTELFVVTAQVKQLFETCQIRKGDTVTSSSIRDILKSYVKENSLQNEQNPKEIILDPMLTDCVLRKGENRCKMIWEELHEAMISKMTHAYQIEFEGKDKIVKKGKLEPITVSVDTRTGNKKVTLIQNLETYGIKPENLAHHVQVTVAASTSITPTPNGKGTLVLIQGNQVRYLQKLFLDIYKVPRKYLQGLDIAVKKK